MDSLLSIPKPQLIELIESSSSFPGCAVFPGPRVFYPGHEHVPHRIPLHSGWQGAGPSNSRESLAKAPPAQLRQYTGFARPQVVEGTLMGGHSSRITGGDMVEE